MAGSHNEIIVLNLSLLFNRLMKDTAPNVSFEINGNGYNKPYYLTGGIYLDWVTLVKIICNPQTKKVRDLQGARGLQKRCGVRKNVEWAFGMLQTRWAIIRHPART
jgi:hypothetical protein